MSAFKFSLPAAGILALSLLVLPSQADAQGGPRAAVVGVDDVVKAPLSQTFPVLGRMVARQTGPVAARISGPVAEVLVDVGDTVESGQVLVRLVTEEITRERSLRAADLVEARAALQTARAQIRLLRQEQDRLEGLRQSAAFSQARLDDKAVEVLRAESEAAEYAAAVQRAQANVSLADLAMVNSEIKAPYPGIVTQRHTEVGAYITTGDAVVNMINANSLEVEADVPADRVAGLTPGVEIEADIRGHGAAKAAVRAVIPEENPLTRTRAVRFTPALDGAAISALANNQSVTVLVPLGEPRDVVSVHKDAVTAKGDQRLVFMMVDGKAQIRPVQLGDALGNRFEVISGLVPGDVVVVRGNERLRPGQDIRAGNRPAPAETAPAEKAPAAPPTKETSEKTSDQDAS